MFFQPKLRNRATKFLAAIALALGVVAIQPVGAAGVASQRAVVAPIQTPTPGQTPTAGPPRIQILNPAKTPEGQALFVSDKRAFLPEGVPVNETYQLVAWASGVPADPLVEFELQGTSPNTLTRPLTLGPARRDAPDTFAFDWDISTSVPDGEYLLRAILYSRDATGEFEEVARDEETVTVLAGERTAVDVADFVYPRNGGTLGVYKPAATGVTIFDIRHSLTRQQAGGASFTPSPSGFFGYFTTSKPGSEPEWQECAAENRTNAANGLRCTLTGVKAASAVTAVAVAATSSQGFLLPEGNVGTDAARIFPYEQVPTLLSPTGQLGVTVAPQSGGGFPCSPNLGVLLTDQFGLRIGGGNIDWHAAGPNDQLAFYTANIPGFGAPAAVPDKNHPGKEDGNFCFEEEQNIFDQGDHNRPGLPDFKHVETGTSDTGTASIRLRSPDSGGTYVTAWAESDNDDLQQLPEPTAGYRVGWGAAPPPPIREVMIDPRAPVAVEDTCQRIFLTARESGNPIASTNLDVHLAGPDGSVTFCRLPDGGELRAPDSSLHVPEEGVNHFEGETDAAGRMVFGVFSETRGMTQMNIWIDASDDDVQAADEPGNTFQIQWVRPGQRTIRLFSSDSRVRRGTRVRLFGRLNGDDTCLADQTVKIKGRAQESSRFRTIRTVTTGEEGRYSVRIKVQTTRFYRAVAPRSGPCGRARSDVLVVRPR